ncbi:helix-turn-helix domain-containing protein [Methylobacterium mesophilicum]|uniref:helix-turn-helix domain-containing protein n=1 Tax=Methylobacterium mesophilicum TaxID=39956 RepID=UPI0034D708C5
MSEALKRAIGQRVRDARQEAGLTQEDFAARIHRTPESISKLERGVTLPDITTLLEIASATGKALSTFLDLPEARPTRSPTRQRLEAKMARFLAKLPDGQLRVAVDLIEVLARRADSD